VAYFLISIEVYLATYTFATFFRSLSRASAPRSFASCWAIGTLTLWNRPLVQIGGSSYPLFDVGGAVAIAGMIVVAMVSAIRNTRALYLQERLP